METSAGYRCPDCDFVALRRDNEDPFLDPEMNPDALGVGGLLMMRHLVLNHPTTATSIFNAVGSTAPTPDSVDLALFERGVDGALARW